MTLSAHRRLSPEAPGATTSPTKVLAIVCAGVVLASLDLFIVNVALPRIAADLGATDLAELSWILNGYAIVYASLLVFFGRLADRYRRDRAFLLGVAVFTAASAACAASTSVGMLIAFRLVQAAGAALLTPTSLGIVLATFEPERRQGAVRAWTAIGGMAAAAGPVLGGLLVAASWRWAFLVNVPVGIVALAVGWRRLPAVPGHATERPDPLGVVLVTAGVGFLTFGLVKGSGWGWTSAQARAVLAAAVVLLGVFVLHCARSRTPLVHPELFRSRQFTGASIVAIFFSASFAAMLLSVMLWEQTAWGWSALRAGLAFAPGPLMVPIFSFLVAGRLTRRYGPAAVITVGSLAFGAGMASWALAVTASPDYISGVLAGTLITGAGVGLTLPVMMATAAASLPPHAFATGSAVITMIRQTGVALGVAILVAVLGVGAAQNVGVSHAAGATQGSGAARAAVALASFQRGWWVIVAISVAGIIPALALLRRPSHSTSKSP